MTQIRRTPTAVDDLVQIGDFISTDNLAAATRVVQKITDEIESLARHPMIGEACPQIAEGIRRSAVGNYVIFYRPLEDGVLILRVLHGARNVNPTFFDTE